MNLRCFTVKHNCLENNFPKITRTSKLVRGLKPCYCILFFTFCFAWVASHASNKCTFPETIPVFWTQFYFQSSVLHKTLSVHLHSHTTPKKEHSPLISASDHLSIGGVGKLFKVRVRVSNSFSVLVYFNHILTSCHLLSLSFICSRYFCSCS